MSTVNLASATLKNGRYYYQLPITTGSISINKRGDTTHYPGTSTPSYTIPTIVSVDTTGQGYQGGIPRLTLNITSSALAAVTHDTKVSITGSFTNAYGSTITERSGKLSIKGRGNTTWTYPQKPYAIGLVTSDNKDDKASLTLPGFYADSDLVLLANYADPTGGIRTYIIQELARSLGLIAVKTLPIEVYTTDGYQGLYLITEKIKNSLVSLIAPTTSGATPDQFGYMYETVLDFQEDLTTENTFKTPLFGNSYPGPTHINDAHSVNITYPKFGKLTAAQATYAQNKWLALEASLAYPWSDKTNGPASILENSNNELFAFIAVMEFSRSVDMISHSFDSYIQPEGKFKFIPWDFDLAFPIYTMYAFEGNSPTNSFIDRCPIFKTLFLDNDFKAEFNIYYTNIAASAVTNSINLGIQKSQLLLDTGAISRNLAKWQTTNNDFSIFLSTNQRSLDYDTHLQGLINFTNSRKLAMSTRYHV